jgi:hypothetical protein
MGSKIGWILSVVLVLGLVGFVLYMVMVPSPSEPTFATGGEDFVRVHSIRVSPAVFLGAEPSAPGNAADDYRQAVAVFKTLEPEMRRTYGRLNDITGGRYAPPPNVLEARNKIVAFAVAGAAKKNMEYYSPDKLAVKSNCQPAADLTDVTTALEILVAWHTAGKRYDQEEQALRTIFIMGWHMANEHTRAGMILEGLTAQERVLNTLDELYQEWDPKKHEALLKGEREYGASLGEVKRFQETKWKAIWKDRPEPGDLYRIIRLDQDRAWRVEALLALGVVRFTHEQFKGDMRVTLELLNQYSQDPDPYLRAAARCARALTEEGFNRVIGS